jgi:hypothetical protein
MDVSGQIHPAQFNPGKEPPDPRASLDVEKRNICVSTKIRTLDHLDGGIDAVHTTTLWHPKHHPETGHDIQSLPSDNLERNPASVVQEAG